MAFWEDGGSGPKFPTGDLQPTLIINLDNHTDVLVKKTFPFQTVSGKATLDFKDQEAVACLTSSLLFRDFQLRVHLPPGRLIPTLPLRLNYLLWIEDLISLLPVEYHENVCGVDIGKQLYFMVTSTKSKIM